jgi:hypothetical protein
MRRHFKSIGSPTRFGQVGRQPHPLILTCYEALAVLPSCQVPMLDRLREAMLVRYRAMLKERYQNPAARRTSATRSPTSRRCSRS